MIYKVKKYCFDCLLFKLSLLVYLHHLVGFTQTQWTSWLTRLLSISWVYCNMPRACCV